MKKNNVFRGIGVAALTLGLFFNVQYALVDYGMHNSSLGTQLTAQTNSNGGSSGGDGSGGDGTGTSGSGWLWKKKMTNSPCTGKKWKTYWLYGGILYGAYVSGAVQVEKEITYTGNMTRCDDGWNFCSADCEGVGDGSST